MALQRPYRRLTDIAYAAGGELLLRAARLHPDIPGCLAIINATSRQPNWDNLVQLAEKHRVVPLLFRALNALPSHTAPPGLLHDLKGRFFRNTHKNFNLTTEMFRLLDLFSSRKIRAIPYKGTVLASDLYGKVSLRQVWDIDILVHPDDRHASREILVDEDYVTSELFDREECLVNRHRDTEVDLHWGLTPYFFPVDVDFDAFWQCRGTVNMNGRSVSSFSRVDLLVVLCIQVAKDCWEKRQRLEHLLKVADIAALLDAEPDLDWSAFFRQTREIGIERIAAFALILAYDLQAAMIPAAVLERIAGDGHARSLAEEVEKQLFSGDDRDFSPDRNSVLDINLRLNQLRFYLRIREKSVHKLQHLAHITKTMPTLLKHELNAGD